MKVQNMGHLLELLFHFFEIRYQKSFRVKSWLLIVGFLEWLIETVATLENEKDFAAYYLNLLLIMSLSI